MFDFQLKTMMATALPVHQVKPPKARRVFFCEQISFFDIAFFTFNLENLHDSIRLIRVKYLSKTYQ